MSNQRLNEFKAQIKATPFKAFDTLEVQVKGDSHLVVPRMIGDEIRMIHYELSLSDEELQLSEWGDDDRDQKVTISDPVEIGLFCEWSAKLMMRAQKRLQKIEARA